MARKTRKQTHRKVSETKHISSDFLATQAIAEGLARLHGEYRVILLQGELGAGKTTFVQGFAREKGISGRIASPTFTYQRIYPFGDKILYHFDCYRLNADSVFLSEEFQQAISDPRGIVLIEWPDRLSQEVLPSYIGVDILHSKNHASDERHITITYYDRS